jgi:hypothetical protein
MKLMYSSMSVRSLLVFPFAYAAIACTYEAFWHAGVEVVVFEVQELELVGLLCHALWSRSYCWS